MAEPSYADLVGLANQLSRIAGLLKGPIQLTGSEEPGNLLGAPGASAFNLDTRTWYGPKDPVTGWGEGIPLTQGPSAKAVVIAAGLLPADATDAQFATWLANSQIAAVQPYVDDAEAARDAAQAARTGAETAETNAETAATAAAADADATGADRAATESARDATLAAKDQAETAQAATAADRDATGADRTATAADRVATGEDRTAAHASAQSAAEDAAATAADRVATGEDRAAAAASAQAASDDAAATAADRVATGQDVTAADGHRQAAQTAQAAAEQARDEAQAIAGGDFQPQDATLTALAALDSAPGVLVQTGADAFAKRPIGAAAADDLLDRQTGDARYATPAALSAAINALVDGAPTALDTLKEIADALAADDDAIAALVLALDGKQAASATLTALAALTTTAFGRALLEKTDAAALKSALAIAIADVSGLATALAARVQTVNGVAPDGAGNVVVEAGVSSVAGLTGSVSAGALNAALGLPSEFALIALTLADLRGDQQGMAAGIADAFDDEDGVSSVFGWSYDAANDWYRSTAGTVFASETTQTLPAMTSDTAPFPWIASSVNVTRSPYLVFNQAREGSNANVYSLDASWSLTRRASNGQQYRIWRYRIICYNPSEGPRAWTLEARNNNTGSWVTLDTQSGQTWSSAGQSRDYVIASASRGLYSDYRLTITNGVSIDEIELHQEVASSEPSALTSASFAAGSAPTTAMLTVLLRASAGAYVLNTDVKAFVSRDGGTTWTQVTLVAGATASGFTTCEGTASLTGQPSGTALRYRIDVVRDGTRQIDVTGVALQWRS